jgi:hypothetical protein
MSNRNNSRILNYDERNAAHLMAEAVHGANQAYELATPNRTEHEDGTVVQADPVVEWIAGVGLYETERTALDDMHDAILLDGGSAFYNCVCNRIDWIACMEADDMHFSG